MTYTYACEKIPTFDPGRMREDFEAIFLANAVDVEIISNRKDRDVTHNGDFFGTRTEPETLRRIVKMFIEAENSNAYRRDRQGIVTNDSTFHAFCRWDVDLENDDLVKFLKDENQRCFGIKPGEVFIIQNHNKPFYRGQYVWQEFTLKRVDHDAHYSP